MKGGTLKAECFLRLFSVLLAILAACLVGLDTQTKLVFFTIERKATNKDLPALSVMVIVEAVAAGYQFIQLCKSCIKANQSGFHKSLAWLDFFLDQMVAYVTFGAIAAAAQASCFAVTGAEHFEWMKLCNIYTRFCEQIGGGLACGLLGSLLMAAVSSISAFHLFRAHTTSKQSFVVNRGPL
ncbi:hypothetical protein AAC387_Pa03g0157 [Persea americana]